MTFQIQKDYKKKKRKRYQNEKEDINSKKVKQEFKNIKHDLNSLTNCICLQDAKKKSYDNTTQCQPNQNKRRKEIYEQTRII